MHRCRQYCCYLYDVTQLVTAVSYCSDWHSIKRRLCTPVSRQFSLPVFPAKTSYSESIVPPADEEAQGRGMPRVDTFASNLHDSWGAHAEHDSPPANESTLEDPPRLSTESMRSATSAASKASSGESPILFCLAN